MSQNYDTTKYDEKATHGEASGEDLLSISDIAKVRKARLDEAAARGAHVVNQAAADRQIPQERKFITMEERRKRDEDILKKAGV